MDEEGALDELLRTGGEFALCNAVFKAFAVTANSLNASAMCECERVIALVWHSYGLVGNGGFEYLLSADFEGDPGFVCTAAAYRAIGAETAYRCFQEALGSFPSSIPHADLEARRAYYANEVDRDVRDRIDRTFWGAGSEIEGALAAYIRENAGPLKIALRRLEAS